MAVGRRSLAAGRVASATADRAGILDALKSTQEDINELFLELESTGLITPRFDPTLAASASSGQEALAGGLGRRAASESSRRVTEAGGSFGGVNLRAAQVAEANALANAAGGVLGARQAGANVAGQAALQTPQLIAANRRTLGGLTANIGVQRAQALEEIFSQVFGLEAQKELRGGFLGTLGQIGGFLGNVGQLQGGAGTFINALSSV